MNFFLHFMLISLKIIFLCYTFYIIKIINLIKAIAIKEKKVKYKFPEDLYTEVRIEDYYSANYYLKDDDAEGNGEVSVIGAKIRVFDGKM